MLIEMKVAGLAIDPYSNMPIVILKNPDNEDQVLPIWIGMLEASAIATELEKIQLSRPMTHDLLKNILIQLGVSVDHIAVVDLKENTFYAKIFIKKETEEISIDARPSDSIALALRTNAKILVEEEVIQKSRSIELTEKDIGNKSDREKLSEILANLTPEEFGKYKM